jgi:hypothetical protein
MNVQETQIRRRTNGSIDTDHYIRRCHHRRSLAAHKAIARFLVMIGTLFGGVTGNKQHPPRPGVISSLSKQRQGTNLAQVLRNAA